MVYGYAVTQQGSYMSVPPNQFLFKNRMIDIEKVNPTIGRIFTDRFFDSFKLDGKNGFVDKIITLSKQTFTSYQGTDGKDHYLENKDIRACCMISEVI